LGFRLEPHKAGIVARLNYDQFAAIPGAIRKNHATVETDGKRLAGINLDRQRARHERVEGSAKWMRNASQSLEIVIRQLVGDGTDKVSAIADQALHRRSIEITQRLATMVVRVRARGKDGDSIRCLLEGKCPRAGRRSRNVLGRPG
jgi:hypothetical protein